MIFARSQISLAILTVMSSATFAQQNEQLNSKATNNSPIQLNTIIVEALQTDTVGQTTYNQDDLKKIPNSSKNITDFLKIHPNVQFSNTHLAASNQANLKPAEISINGAQEFQNKFIINGLSNTNTLDPVGFGDSQTGMLSGGSQGIAINTDLICKLEVLDSNVSAKHSGFTGGVIRAETCAPMTEIGNIHGSISYDYSSSDWARYHVTTEADRKLFNGESTQDNQAEYTKQGITANLYSTLSNTLGIDLSAAFRSSILPVNSGFGTEKIDQTKTNTNLGATLFYEPSEQRSAKFGFNLGDLESDNYVESRIRSQNKIKNKSGLFFAELNQKTAFADMKHRLNFKNIENDKDWEQSIGKSWLHSPDSKNWQNTAKVFEGGLGSDIQLKQKTLSYDFDAEFNQFKFGNTQHKISTGIGYSHDSVAWVRPSDSLNFVSTTHNTRPTNITLQNLNGASCLSHDLLCDEATTSPFFYRDNPYIYDGQYFSKGSLYKAGRFQSQFDQAYLYIEDEIEWKNLNARFGLRADYDGANRNFNIAPRSSFHYQPFTTPILTLSTGWSRYYSAPTYITELHKEIGNLQYSINRADHLSEWIETANITATNTRKNRLKTPYSDEFVFAINSEISNIRLGLKWVNRQFKDEVSRSHTNIAIPNGFNYSYEYRNDGYGEADTYSLTANTIQPITFKHTEHHLGMTLNYSDVFRGTPNYTDNFKEQDMFELVSYDGKILPYADRPASNYNQPFTARMSWDIRFKNSPFRMYHFLSYKDSYQQVIESSTKVVHEGKKLDTYTLEEIKPRLSWDMRSTYDIQLAKNYKATLGLSINNLTNRNNLYVSNSKLYSEIGRQYIADLTFKF